MNTIDWKMANAQIIPNISVDCVIFGFQEAKLKVLLIKRSNAFMKSQWSLPGQFIFTYESAEEAAIRILYEMSGVKDIYLDQISTFSDVNRVKTKRIVTIAYMALVNIEKHRLKPFIKEAEDAEWYDLNRIPGLALDHNEILNTGLTKLKRRFRFEPLGFELLPEKFSLRDLQNLYESLFKIQLDNRNFRKKILKIGHLTQLNEKQTNVSHRSASLYSFNKEKYNQLRKNGVNIDLLPQGYIY
ncbi:MAG: NUDIX domain-containing protein [Cytophagales bacterium]|nr:NUDIX domain-containing protein [Cytophagales bacterium]